MEISLINKKVSRMDIFRLTAIVLPMTLLIACVTNGATLPTEKGATTPLHNAVATDEAKVVASFLDGGADIEARNEKGRTPLQVAAVNSKPEVVALLLDRGADTEVRTEDGKTSLHIAAADNIPEVVALLLNGADIEVRNEKGETPLHFAAAHNKPEVITLLLDRGADINARDDVGPSQVFWSRVFLKTFLATLSLSYVMLDPDAARDVGKGFREILYSPVTFNPGGNTPLHFAIEYNKPEVVALLLDRGADINAHTEFGWTPLHYATIFSATPEVITLLLDRGADAQARDQDDKTPLDYAKNNEHLKGTDVLERLKAIQE